VTKQLIQIKVFFLSLFLLLVGVVANAQCCKNQDCLKIECGNLYWEDAEGNAGCGKGIVEVENLVPPITFIDSTQLDTTDAFVCVNIVVYDGLLHTTDSILIEEHNGSVTIEDFTDDVKLTNDLIIEYEIKTKNCSGKKCAFGINHICSPCQDVVCEDGLICEDGACIEPPDPCENITCEEGLICEEGECIEPPDPCEKITCEEGLICEDGECITQEAMLELLKLATTTTTTEAGTPAYSDGVQILYTLIVCNTGDVTTTNVTVFDDMPAFVTYLSDDGDYDGATGLWTVGDLAVGECDTLNINVIPDSPDILADIKNTATANSDQTDQVTAENILPEEPCTNCHGIRTFENTTNYTTGNPTNFTGEAPPIAGGFNDGQNVTTAWMSPLGGQGWTLRNGRVYEIYYIIYCGDTCSLDTPVVFRGERGGFTNDMVAALNTVTGENWNFGFSVLGPAQNFDPNGFQAHNYFATNCECGLDGFGFRQVDFSDRTIDVTVKLQEIQLCEESPGPATPPEICDSECDCSTFELINHSEENQPVIEPTLNCGNEYHLIPPECSGGVTSYSITNGTITIDGTITNDRGILTIPKTVDSGGYNLTFNIEGCGDFIYKVSVKC